MEIPDNYDQKSEFADDHVNTAEIFQILLKTPGFQSSETRINSGPQNTCSYHSNLHSVMDNWTTKHLGP